MTETRRLAHVERIPIRWGDMDAMGHVNNTVYFRYMEQTRIGWMDALVPRVGKHRPVSIVIANASCNFLKPITYPGTVEVRLYTGKPGGASVPTYYELRVDDEPGVYADGASVVVFVDPSTQKSKRIPEDLREKLLHAEVAA